MLKICLVEDEEYALKSLQQKIIDLNGPYEVVGAAYNGIDAIDIITSRYPDVVITDIRMPDMDGIALIEHINEHNMNVICVIISGYQEFEYAKSAIKLGVEDYLLKPVSSSELRECLAKCMEKVRMQGNKKHIDDILSENISIRWEDTEYFLIYIIFGNAVSGLESIIHPNVYYIPSQDIERRFQAIFACSGRALCFIGACSNEKVIVAQRGQMSEKVYSQKLRRLAEDLEEEYRYPVTVSYRLIERPKLISTQIDLCRKIAVQSVLLGKSNIVSDLPGGNYTTQGINYIIADFLLCLCQKRHDILKSKIQDLLAEWEENRYTLCAIQNDLIYITNSLKHNFPEADNLEFTVAYYIEDIVSVSGAHTDLADAFCSLLIELFGLPLADNGYNLSPARLVDKIERYFRSNLSGNITLSMLCSEMNYSKVHICRVFKKIKNTTPIDYFIQLKIEKAKSVFEQYPLMSVKDVADSLGFSDVYYFSKVFKRITGSTPSAAKERKRDC